MNFDAIKRLLKPVSPASRAELRQTLRARRGDKFAESAITPEEVGLADVIETVVSRVKQMPPPSNDAQ